MLTVCTVYVYCFVVLSQGELEMFAPSQEHNLRLLELPVALQKGKVVLTQDFTVCEEGETLTPERAKILEYLGYKMAKFSLTLVSHYNKEDGFKQLLEISS